MAPSLDFDSGLRALCGIAAYYRIAAEPSLLQREFALGGRVAEMPDLLRAAKRLGPKAREVRSRGAKRTIELLRQVSRSRRETSITPVRCWTGKR